MKEPKLKKCIICLVEFKQFKTTEKVCSLKCAIEHARNVSKEVKLQEYSKALQKNNSTPKTKKKSYKAILQDEVNKLARMIDKYFNYDCIDCNRVLEHNKPNSVHGAHRLNVGGHENIRYNLHNIHSATLFCNKHSTEHKTGYDVGLVERYGQEYLDAVHQLELYYPTLKLNELEIKEALKIVRKLNREFDNHAKGNDLDGAMMRSYFNEVIGIYK